MGGVVRLWNGARGTAPVGSVWSMRLPGPGTTRRGEIWLTSLCEFVWVPLRVYGFQPADIAGAIRALMAAANVEMNRPAVERGLSMLDAGGDFSDGMIAYEASWLGGETFVSFDKNAVAQLVAQGQAARLL